MSVLSKEQIQRTIFLDNLSPRTLPIHLFHVFEPAWYNIEDISVKKRSDRANQYAFVRFKSVDQIQMRPDPAVLWKHHNDIFPEEDTFITISHKNLDASSIPQPQSSSATSGHAIAPSSLGNIVVIWVLKHDHVDIVEVSHSSQLSQSFFNQLQSHHHYQEQLRPESPPSPPVAPPQRQYQFQFQQRQQPQLQQQQQQQQQQQHWTDHTANPATGAGSDEELSHLLDRVLAAKKNKRKVQERTEWPLVLQAQKLSGVVKYCENGFIRPCYHYCTRKQCPAGNACGFLHDDTIYETYQMLLRKEREHQYAHQQPSQKGEKPHHLHHHQQQQQQQHSPDIFVTSAAPAPSASSSRLQTAPTVISQSSMLSSRKSGVHFDKIPPLSPQPQPQAEPIGYQRLLNTTKIQSNSSSRTSMSPPIAIVGESPTHSSSSSAASTPSTSPSLYSTTPVFSAADVGDTFASIPPFATVPSFDLRDPQLFSARQLGSTEVGAATELAVEWKYHDDQPISDSVDVSVFRQHRQPQQRRPWAFPPSPVAQQPIPASAASSWPPFEETPDPHRQYQLLQQPDDQRMTESRSFQQLRQFPQSSEVVPTRARRSSAPTASWGSAAGGANTLSGWMQTTERVEGWKTIQG